MFEWVNALATKAVFQTNQRVWSDGKPAYTSFHASIKEATT